MNNYTLYKYDYKLVNLALSLIVNTFYACNINFNLSKGATQNLVIDDTTPIDDR